MCCPEFGIPSSPKQRWRIFLIVIPQYVSTFLRRVIIITQNSKIIPYQNGDPRIGLGIFQSRTRISLGGSFQFGTLGFCPQIGTGFKTGTPYRYGDPQIGLGRDLSIFQIGESQNRFGVHSNLATNICMGTNTANLSELTVV